MRFKVGDYVRVKKTVGVMQHFHENVGCVIKVELWSDFPCKVDYGIHGGYFSADEIVKIMNKPQYFESLNSELPLV